MMILVYSGFTADGMAIQLGAPQYSYHFVLAGYRAALEELGEVILIGDPLGEVDALYDACTAKGRACVFLCFAPPHLVPITLRCPTVPVLAWEFSTIPCEAWSDDPRADWRVVFRHCGRAITLSGHSAAQVREAMGPDFPVFAIPTASFAATGRHFSGRVPRTDGERIIAFDGQLLDSTVDPLFQNGLDWPNQPRAAEPEEDEASPAPDAIAPSASTATVEDPARDETTGPEARQALTTRLARFLRGIAARTSRVGPDTEGSAPPPGPAPREPDHYYVVRLHGVVYTAVLSPADGRKNWHDLVTAYLWALRDEPHATLVLKMPRSARETMHPHIYHALSRFAPFACRVILVYGYMDEGQYAALVLASDYYVNVSHGEGLCIPLMEFLSAGVPALAPTHTAMADYVTPDLAFTLGSSLEHNVWPFDKRDLFRTMRYRLDWGSIESAFRASFTTALADEGRYAAMAQHAHEAMRAFCGSDIVRARLAEALGARPAEDTAGHAHARPQEMAL